LSDVPLFILAACDHQVLDLAQDQVRDASTSMHHVRADYLLIPVECRTTCYSQEHFGELTDVNA
jgi:hypothetical protein